jgi:hypothetical protein
MTFDPQQSVHVFFYRFLRLGIESARCFVEDQNRWFVVLAIAGPVYLTTSGNGSGIACGFLNTA